MKHCLDPKLIKITTANTSGTLLFQVGVHFSIRTQNARFCQFWLFCCEFTHFLVYFLQAWIMWRCTKIDKYRVWIWSKCTEYSLWVYSAENCSRVVHNSDFWSTVKNSKFVFWLLFLIWFAFLNKQKFSFLSVFFYYYLFSKNIFSIFFFLQFGRNAMSKQFNVIFLLVLFSLDTISPLR